MSTVLAAREITTASSPPAGPVPDQERVEAMDILRGVAILGILIVNMQWFSLPEGLPAHALWPNLLDRTVETLILFFADQQFITLFAFLFGLGLAVQMMRAEARGEGFLRLYLRRLCVLWLIGVAHFVLLWDGDILHAYAQDGLILLFFLRRAPKTLLAWAGILFCIPLLFFGFTTYCSITGQETPEVVDLISPVSLSDTAEDQQDIEETRSLYSSGTYAEIVESRANDVRWFVVPGIDDVYILIGFLLGMYAGRRRIFHDVSAHLPFIRRVQRWGLVIGVAGSAAFAAGGLFDPSPASVIQNVGKTCLIFAAPAMSLFYASTIVLLARGEAWRRRLAPLASVGQMALSNYLLQSLICAFVFYSYGLALFCQVRPSLGLLLTITLWLIQIPLSVWWLRRFQFGPIEWLWRSLTYAKLQPMRSSGGP